MRSVEAADIQELAAEDINRVIVAYLSIGKRLVDLDDVIDVQKTEFDPGVSLLEWQMIMSGSPSALKDQSLRTISTASECISKLSVTYLLSHSDSWLSRLSSST